jgi:NADH:ubiquinone reductase (H+-translocating)
MLSKEASRLTLKHLNSLGIEVHLNTQVKSCEPNKLCLQSGELKGDVIVWTAGSKPVDFYANNADVFTIGRGGRVVADEFLQPIHHKDIFVLGDNVDTPYSGMAQTALHDAKFVAANLLRMHEHSKPKPYAPRKPVYVVTAGPKWAIVEQGNSLTSGRIGWSIRRKADLAIFRNFEPYKQAIKTWQNGNRYSKSI